MKYEILFQNITAYVTDEISPKKSKSEPPNMPKRSCLNAEKLMITVITNGCKSQQNETV